MIPKIIHYCWFGGNPLPEDVKRYIASWKKYCPDYEIRQWNESNLDVTENQYCYEAYKAKKWAFVSDYARVKVLYEYGGIYLDTDVEVVKNLDELLKYKAFAGLQFNLRIGTAVIGCEAKNDWIGGFLRVYDTLHFKLSNQRYDLTTNVVRITKFTQETYNVHWDDNYQILRDNIALFPVDYLLAKDVATGESLRTSNTYTIHHFMGSWKSDKRKEYERKLNLLGKRYTFIEKNLAIKYFVETILAYKVGGWHFVWECAKTVYFKHLKQ